MANIIATNYSRHMLYVLSICMYTYYMCLCTAFMHIRTYVRTYVHTYVQYIRTYIHTCYRHTSPYVDCDLL